MIDAREYNRRVKREAIEVVINAASTLPPPDTVLLREPRYVLVYFLQGKKTQLIKIGYATDLLARFDRIQSHSPDELRLLWCYRAEAFHEDHLHRRFRRWRQHGEWFTLAGDLRDYVTARTPKHFYPGTGAAP